jgi:prenyltransferase beta subunit
MAPLKFRVWHKGYNVMSTGGVFFNNSTGELEHDPLVVVMQWTGLTDMNGVEVFEGDVVEWGKYRRKCLFRDGAFRLVTHVESYGSSTWPQELKAIEVIGNIHANPDLLPS